MNEKIIKLKKSNRNKSIIILLLVFICMFLSYFTYNYFSVQGTTYNWNQSDWSGGATSTTADHINNNQGTDKLKIISLPKKESTT